MERAGHQHGEIDQAHEDIPRGVHEHLFGASRHGEVRPPLHADKESAEEEGQGDQGGQHDAPGGAPFPGLSVLFPVLSALLPSGEGGHQDGAQEGGQSGPAPGGHGFPEGEPGEEESGHELHAAGAPDKGEGHPFQGPCEEDQGEILAEARGECQGSRLPAEEGPLLQVGGPEAEEGRPEEGDDGGCLQGRDLSQVGDLVADAAQAAEKPAQNGNQCRFHALSSSFT